MLHTFINELKTRNFLQTWQNNRQPAKLFKLSIPPNLNWDNFLKMVSTYNLEATPFQNKPGRVGNPSSKSDVIQQYLLNKYTLRIPNIEKIDKEYQNALSELSKYMNRDLKNITAMVSLPGATSPPPHCDSTDVIGIQITGSKIWQMWPRCSNQKLEIEMTVGDVFWVPRECLHEVTHTTNPSIHIIFLLKYQHPELWFKKNSPE